MQILVAGLGRFGHNLALTLTRMGHEVIAIDQSERVVQTVAQHVAQAVVGDATDEAVLREIGAPDVDLAMVAMADVESSVLITTHLSNLEVPLVYAKASSDVHRTILQRVGADRVVFPERDMAVRLARSVGAPSLREYVELLPHLGIAEIEAAPSFVGQTLASLDLRAGLGVNVLVIKRGDELVVMPELTERVRTGDILVLVGRDDQLAKIEGAPAREAT